jgi:hypothetical protein
MIIVIKKNSEVIKNLNFNSLGKTYFDLCLDFSYAQVKTWNYRRKGQGILCSEAYIFSWHSVMQINEACAQDSQDKFVCASGVVPEGE